MRIFVTGAAGFIGTATIKDLVAHGHSVLGLVRTPDQAEKIQKLGAEPHFGDITDENSVKAGAAASDGIIHLAFILNFNDMEGSCAYDRAAIRAMADGLVEGKGSGSTSEGAKGKPFVIASGSLLLPFNGPTATEDTEPARGATPFAIRAESADLIYEVSRTKGIRGSVIRIAAIVHGKGDQSLVPLMVNACMTNGGGTIVYANEGTNRWPTVALSDLATLLRLATEKGAPGSTYHGVAEMVAMKNIMGAAAKSVGKPVKGVSAEEAAEILGMVGHVAAADNPVSSEKTQKELDWTPTGPTLLEDMVQDDYFASAASKWWAHTHN